MNVTKVSPSGVFPGSKCSPPGLPPCPRTAPRQGERPRPPRPPLRGDAVGFLLRDAPRLGSLPFLPLCRWPAEGRGQSGRRHRRRAAFCRLREGRGHRFVRRAPTDVTRGGITGAGPWARAVAAARAAGRGEAADRPGRARAIVGTPAAAHVAAPSLVALLPASGGDMPARSPGGGASWLGA